MWATPEATKTLRILSSIFVTNKLEVCRIVARGTAAVV